MEDRYEIRGQLGKGGVGAVFRAYDRHLNREVAIKRILPGSGAEDRDTALKQLTEEAATLCSLQHPHIVTVYDVGSDKDSPFVVMELLTGKTLEEVVEGGPLTWEDFRELAMQTQEALIAAQEYQLVHRDIKPGNVMLTWLPSGKFQVKLVDFGLAKFTPKPTPQEINEDDSVFGSIFFMAPEQFERKPLDGRTDMYAMGCVYYHALASAYPFTGTTGQEVMVAHLEHRVRPLHEVRKDIPRWGADWVMWHMNRNPDDRPPDARQALERFIVLSEQASKTQRVVVQVPAGLPARPPVPGVHPAQRPRTQPAKPATPTRQVRPAAPAQPARAAAPATPAVAAAAPTPAPAERPEPPPTAPQPLQPPAGSKPSVHSAARKATSAVDVQAEVVEQSVTPTARGAPLLVPHGAMQGAPAPVFVPPVKPKRKLTNAAKAGIAAGAAVVVVLAAFLALDQLADNRRDRAFNALLAEARGQGVREIPLGRAQVELLLDSLPLAAVPDRETIYQCLYLGRSNDGTDVDQMIAARATQPKTEGPIRVRLFKVLEMRGNEAVLPALLEFAGQPGELTEVVAAIDAGRTMATDADLQQFIGILERAAHPSIRRSAEGAIAAIIELSRNRQALADTLAQAYRKQVNNDNRQALLRLLGATGAEAAAEQIKAVLDGPDKLLKQAAVVAAGNWPDDRLFNDLTEYLGGEDDQQLRRPAFETALRFLSSKKRNRPPGESAALWQALARSTRLEREQLAMIDGLARVPEGNWMVAVLQHFAGQGASATVTDRAKTTIARIQSRAGGTSAE